MVEGGGNVRGKGGQVDGEWCAPLTTAVAPGRMRQAGGQRRQASERVRRVRCRRQEWV